MALHSKFSPPADNRLNPSLVGNIPNRLRPYGSISLIFESSLITNDRNDHVTVRHDGVVTGALQAFTGSSMRASARRTGLPLHRITHLT
jgi:hypothetical protein